MPVTFFKSATKFIHPFTKVFTLFLLFFAIVFIAPLAHATAGINGQINIQGKLQNKSDSTNVADNTYTVVFTLYDAASGGTNLWTETQSVTTKDGVFFVALGSVNPLTSVNFNSDSLYLGIKVGSDAEMTPRIQFGSVPYAFNAQKVNGLTVTNTSDTPFSSATTLKIGDGKTVVFNNGLTFSGTDSTGFTFPNTTDTVVTQDFAQTLTNKTIGSTGLTFSGATTDITTGTNEDLTISPNGTGNTIFTNGNVGIGSTTPKALLDLQQTGNSKGIVNLNGDGNQTLFTASSSGNTKFIIDKTGNVGIGTSAPSKLLYVSGNQAGGIATIERTSSLTSGQLGTLSLIGTSTGLKTFGTGGLGVAMSMEVNDVSNTVEDLADMTATHYAVNPNTGLWRLWVEYNGSTQNNAQLAVNGNGSVGIGTDTPSTILHVTDGTFAALGKALAIFDQNENQDILTASASGTPVFTITKAGGIMLGTNVGTGTQCLVGGATASWGSCGSGTSLFTDAGSFTYLNSTTDDLVLGASTTSAAAFWLQVTDGASPANTTLSLGTDGSKNAILKLFSSAAGKASTMAVDSSGNLTIAAASGSTVNVGNGSGNIQMSLSHAADLFIADKTLTLGAAYSGSDYTFKRVLTGGANNQTGAVFTITDLSAGSGTISPDMLVVNSALTSGTFTGNLLRLQVGGIDKVLVNSAGNVGIGTTAPSTSLQIKDNPTVAVPGTLGVTNGSTSVSTSTDTRTVLNVGDAITFASQPGTVYTATLLTSTSITLNTAYTGTTNAATTAITDADPLSVLNSAGTSILTLTKSGYLGLGAAPNAANLYIDSLAPAGANAAKFYSSSLTVGNIERIRIGSSDSNNNAFGIEFKQDATASTVSMHFFGDSFGDSLLFMKGGNLGVGLGSSLTPKNKLDVKGSMAVGSYAGANTGPSNGIIVSGNVGIGTTAPKAALDIWATSGTTPVASVSGSTSFAGLIVDNSGVGDIFTASSSGTTRFTIQQSGVVKIGNSTDGLTFDYLNGGPTYAGKARPMKTITLSPEYAGAALTQFYGAGTDTSNITGTMTSDASTSAGLRTHYSWTSSTASPLQSYTVAVRVTLPQDFSQWCTTSVGCSNTNALQIDYNTLAVQATNNDLNVYIYNSSNTSTAVYTSTGNVVGSLDGWGTLSIQKASLEGTQTWNTAGQTAIIYLRMQAMNNYHVLLGDIKLNYLAKF